MSLHAHCRLAPVKVSPHCRESPWAGTRKVDVKMSTANQPIFKPAQQNFIINQARLTSFLDDGYNYGCTAHQLYHTVTRRKLQQPR